MIQVYADGALIYDSRLDDLKLLELKVTRSVSKAGTATLTMPPHHPAYNDFVSYRTEVTIYRDGVLIFRGRALYPTDDFNLKRTITCEGERCFLRDAVMRPYIYQDSPAAIFADVVGKYNARVETFKQFVVGSVTVTDPNDYVRLESESAEYIADTIDKLVERVGGYIVFTTTATGQRAINWLAKIGTNSAQAIEFGTNLLDFQRTTANSDLATVITPYGAKDESTGERVTIESVNDGLDFIRDEAAVALRGVIEKAVYWDDVTTPSILLTKAQQYLEESKKLVLSLELSAVDLSVMGKDIDTFTIGDMIKVNSRPHKVVDEWYQLTEQSLDLLHPKNDKVTLGKDVASLTGADAAGDKKTVNELHRVEHNVKIDYKLNTAAAVEAATSQMTSLIQQTSEAIRSEVNETYITKDGVESFVGTSFTQWSEGFEMEFQNLQDWVNSNETSTEEQFKNIEKYIRFEDGNIILGESGNTLTLRIENDRISFLDAGAEVAYFSDQKLTVTNGHFLKTLQIGNFAFLPRKNGNLSLVRVGD